MHPLLVVILHHLLPVIQHLCQLQVMRHHHLVMHLLQLATHHLPQDMHLHLEGILHRPQVIQSQGMALLQEEYIRNIRLEELILLELFQ